MIGVAIPITVKDKLITADYFYLLCATDSVMVADGFLNAYEEELREHVVSQKPAQNQVPLPFEVDQVSTDLQDGIVRWLAEQPQNKSQLTQILYFLFSDFLSWKTAMRKAHYQVPTIKNVIEALNILFDQGKIQFINAKDYLYKRRTQGHAAGTLNLSRIRSGKDTQAILIQLK